MQMAISAQKPPARNALIVGVSCVNPTWKPVADATRFSVRVAFSSIERFEACAPGTSGEKKRLARQRLPKQNTSVFTSGSGHGHDAVEMAIPAKHVYRKRSARYRLALAWLIAAYRLGKAWSLRMSYSCLSPRLSRLSGTVHAAYQKI